MAEPEAPGLVETDGSTPQERLADLTAQATALYAVKDYKPAAELFSQATELQAEINGEMAVDNADLLYSYGKCLYFVAVRNSEVLGASSASAQLSAKKEADTKPTKKRKLNGDSSKPVTDITNGAKQEQGSSQPATDPASDVVTEADNSVKKEEPSGPTKPYFNITGDENWDDLDDGEDAEDVEEDDGAEEEEDQDDFSLAFEVLDLSRVLLLRKLDALQQSALEDSSDKGKYVPSIDLAPPVREVKERIADVHDLQAEISLEGEEYKNAVLDLKAALALKEELYPFESNYVAECFYKLSLALEFGSKSQQRDEDGNPVGETKVDEAMRAESITAMEQAIGSCQRRIMKEQVEVDNLEPGARLDKAMKDVDEVREIVEEMEQRLADLKAEPVDAVQEAARQQSMDVTEGLLKQMMGGSKEEAMRMLEEATGSAKDLSGLVKKKKPKAEGKGTATPEASSSGSMLGKRKVAFTEDGANGKKARVEDVEDSGL